MGRTSNAEPPKRALAESQCALAGSIAQLIHLRSGHLAMFAAIQGASFLLSSLAADRRPGM